MTRAAEIIDDLTRTPGDDPAGAWRLISDGVMGGLSGGTLRHETVQRRPALRMRGRVRLENNGGFVQFARDLAPDGSAVDASGWDGIALTICGNGARYNLHLRTTALSRPWQSYRASFTAPEAWVTLRLAFADFAPHRTDRPFDPARLRRIGIVAIGAAFDADVALADLRFYRG